MTNPSDSGCKPAEFCWIRRDFFWMIFRDRELSGSDWRVLLLFLSDVGRDGVSSRSQPDIARETGLCLQAVNRSAGRLVRKGYMRKVGKNGKIVRFGFDPKWVERATPEEELEAGRDAERNEDFARFSSEFR